MRDKIEFHFRFALNYIVALGCAVLAAVLISTLAGSNYGFPLQVIAFTAAFYFARRKFRPYLEHMIFQSNRVILDRFLLTTLIISAVAAAIAIGIDRLILPQVAAIQFFQAELQGGLRYLLLGVSYFVIALILTELVAQQMIKNGHLVIDNHTWDDEYETASSQNPVPSAIVELLMELPADQRDILMRGAAQPGVPLITTKGSDNDRLWTLLANYDWLKPSKLPRSIAKQIPRGQKKKSFAAWKITPKGATLLKELRQIDPRANLRVVNG